jgi:DNA invertase Pin-like site-specific DNA recombinase
MPLIGYARDSTDDQVADAQTDVLTTAGCAVIFRE